VFRFQKISLLNVLTVLTFFFITAQAYMFVTHYKVSDLMDTLVGSSIALQMLHPVIVLPIISFILLQCAAYVVWVMWIWFVTGSLASRFELSHRMTIVLGVFVWCLACISMLGLNRYYFPDSLFANLLGQISFYSQFDHVILIGILFLLLLMTAVSYIHFFITKKFLWSGNIILFCMIATLAMKVYDSFFLPCFHQTKKPNIILIGIDSLRPDFTGFYGNKTIHTPTIDFFLNQSTSFSAAYTPLARTFPTWISILTAKYPRHHEARNNLVDPDSIIHQETLAKRLQQAGYETIYATDEKRFSNITKAYGFDRILGPRMGVNDFLLGGLSDFPLCNLIVNLPFGRFLFPYNYGNRAATITYQPESFLQLIKSGLNHLPQKPVFLSVHLCLSHWPNKWADRNHPGSPYLVSQYQHSVEVADKQLNNLLETLKKSGLLENSWVVLLSDHGTSMGLQGDRIISEAKYQGDSQKMKMIPRLKLSDLPHQQHKLVYTLNTAYGQGTNILSQTQYHALLAFRRYGEKSEINQIQEQVSLLDIAPTLLDMLGETALAQADGISLRNYFFAGNLPGRSRPLFLETGDSFSEIETDHIYLEKVIRHEIGVYGINPLNGQLVMNPVAAQSMIKNKQLGVMWGDWILARYPVSKQKKHIVPPYFILANMKTGEWTVGLDSAFASKAPTRELMGLLKNFYGEEL
jgi:arylsulfatase A-like enzyme